METKDYGTVKLILFSKNITREELNQVGKLLAEWGADNRKYGIIAHMPHNAKTITDINTIRKTLSSIRNSTLEIYGIQNDIITGYLTRILGQLLGLNVKQFPDYPTMLQQMKEDNPDYKTVIEENNLEAVLATFA